MTTEPSRPTSRRPVGRPRGDGKPHLTRQRVFEICTKLIAQHGFAGTSIRMMASALDASPASLFNLFGSKDGLLNELIAFGARGSFEFYEKLLTHDAAPEVLLYKSIHEEVVAVASADQDHVGIFYLPELRKPAFSGAQAIRAQMVQHFEALIARCVESGSVDVPSVELSAEQVFQLTETSILAPRIRQTLSPEAQARHTADFCLRALGVDKTQLPDIRRAASAIPLRIEPPIGESG